MKLVIWGEDTVARKLQNICSRWIFAFRLWVPKLRQLEQYHLGWYWVDSTVALRKEAHYKEDIILDRNFCYLDKWNLHSLWTSLAKTVWVLIFKLNQSWAGGSGLLFRNTPSGESCLLDCIITCNDLEQNSRIYLCSSTRAFSSKTTII